MKYINYIAIFSLILFVGLSVVCAADNTTEVTDNTELTPIESNTNINQEISQTNGATPPITTTNTVTVTSTNDISTISDDTTYDIQSNLNLGTITASNLNNVVFTSTNSAKLTNTVFELSGTNIQISDIEFENTNTNGPISIKEATNVIINDNTINYRKETTGDTFGIYLEQSNYVTINNNEVTVTATPQLMNWFAYPENEEYPGYYGAPTVAGILINNSNYTDVTYNTVTVNSTSETVDHTMASTFDGISVINNTQYDNINYNTINVNGSEYIYGITSSFYITNLNINYNTITVNGSNHVAGIQSSSTKNSVIKGNTITGNCTATSGSTMSCEAFAYGIILSTELYQSSVCETYNNEVDNNIINLNSTIAYGIQLNNADYNDITNNNVHTYGNATMGIGMYNSSYNLISNNYLIITGETITLNPYIYDAIYPETTGIKINETSTNNNITGNHINVVDTGNTIAYSVMFYSTGVNTIDGNNMTSAGTDSSQIKNGNAGIWLNCYIYIGDNGAYQ